MTREEAFKEINETQDYYINELYKLIQNNKDLKTLDFQSPTGTGKTKMMSKLMNMMPDIFFLVTTLSKGQLDIQITNNLKKDCKYSNYLVYGVSKLHAGTKLTAQDLLDKFPKDKELIWLRDEGHIESRVWREILEKKCKTVINFSATTKKCDIKCNFTNTMMLRTVIQGQGTPESALKKLLEIKEAHKKVCNYNPCAIMRILEDGELYNRTVKFCKDHNLKYINITEETFNMEELCQDNNEYDVIINKFKIVEGIDIRRAHILFMMNEPSNSATTIQVIGRCRRNALLYRDDIDILAEENKELLENTRVCYTFYYVEHMTVDQDEAGELCQAFCDKISCQELRPNTTITAFKGRIGNGLKVLELKGQSGVFHIGIDEATGFNVIEPSTATDFYDVILDGNKYLSKDYVNFNITVNDTEDYWCIPVPKVDILNTWPKKTEKIKPDYETKKCVENIVYYSYKEARAIAWLTREDIAKLSSYKVSQDINVVYDYDIDKLLDSFIYEIDNKFYMPDVESINNKLSSGLIYSNLLPTKDMIDEFNKTCNIKNLFSKDFNNILSSKTIKLKLDNTDNHNFINDPYFKKDSVNFAVGNIWYLDIKFEDFTICLPRANTVTYKECFDSKDKAKEFLIEALKRLPVKIKLRNTFANLFIQYAKDEKNITRPCVSIFYYDCLLENYADKAYVNKRYAGPDAIKPTKELLHNCNLLKTIPAEKLESDNYYYYPYQKIYNDKESAIIGLDKMAQMSTPLYTIDAFGFVERIGTNRLWIEAKSVSTKMNTYCKLDTFISKKYKDEIDSVRDQFFGRANEKLFKLNHRCVACIGYCIEYYAKYLVYGPLFLNEYIISALQESKSSILTEAIIVRACMLKHIDDVFIAYGGRPAKLVKTISMKLLMQAAYKLFVDKVVELGTRTANYLKTNFNIQQLKEGDQIYSPNLSLEHISGLCDLIVDDKIIDLKSTGTLDIKYVKQVLAYHYLSTKRNDLNIKEVITYDSITDKDIRIKITDKNLN